MCDTIKCTGQCSDVTVAACLTLAHPAQGWPGLAITGDESQLSVICSIMNSRNTMEISMRDVWSGLCNGIYVFESKHLLDNVNNVAIISNTIRKSFSDLDLECLNGQKFT